MRLFVIGFLAFTLTLANGFSPSSQTVAQSDQQDAPQQAVTMLDTLVEQANPTEETGKVRFLGAPYAFANSDLGLVVGAGGGISKEPGFYSLFFIDGSLGGLLEGGISSMEIETENWRILDISWIAQKVLYIYTLSDNDPQILAGALQTQYEFNISALKKMGNSGWEIGPTTLVRFVRTREARDLRDPNDPKKSLLYTDGRNIPRSTFARFEDADVELIGFRARYSNTNPVRPTDGWVFESAVRAGRTDGDAYAVPRFDMDFEGKIAWAIPVTERSRFYLRAWTIFQLEAPQPVQQFLGWDRNHRGQPYMREWGRRYLSGRVQYYHTIAHNSGFPWVPLHNLWHVLPPSLLDYEIVPFYDVGVIGDPQCGWHETRHGFGIGIHAVLPPDLVFRLDFCYAPEGPVRFYLGAGEAI